MPGSSSTSPIPDLAEALRRALGGDPSLVRTDLGTRLLYSTDASIYQSQPLGVVFPRTVDDLQAIVEISATYQTPILARGSGSSLAGQAIGPALIVDCARHLDRILEINREEGFALVEPGVIMTALNRKAGQLGLQFGPDPASAERATLAGSIANNAAGAHSICYGMAADHLLAATAVLSDGSRACFEEISLDEAARRANRSEHLAARAADIYQAALDIRARYASEIQQHWPRTWRCASGYSLNYLLSWSASQPPGWAAPRCPSAFSQLASTSSSYPPVRAGTINLAHLLAGSEGTLAVLEQLKIRLVPLPKHSILGLLAFDSIQAACQAVPGLLESMPAAIELIPFSLVHLAKSLPAYANQLTVLAPLAALRAGEDPAKAALLAVEFAGNDPGDLRRQARKLGKDTLLLEDSLQQRQVWAVRKVGLGILLSRPGNRKPWAFIEDLAVPVDRLSYFVSEIEHILAEHGTTAEMYAHASAGCLHIRPLLDLQTLSGVRSLRGIAAQAVELTISLGGSVSGEHGDGQARSEWLVQMFGRQLTGAFLQLKRAADPAGLLNPGKIINVDESEPLPKMDADLRFGAGYQARSWAPALDFTRQGGLTGAIEQCNGAGVCRKADGLMCPSFQASAEEQHSTRGRANLLRALISGAFPVPQAGEQAVFAALDLCLACKGCKAECPSGVDVAKLKYEFTHQFYKTHPRQVRDYLFAYIATMGRLGQPFASLVNPILSSPRLSAARQRWLGITSQRSLPALSEASLQRQWRGQAARSGRNGEEVLFLSDPFSEYFQPQAGIAALNLLTAAGCQVRILPVVGAGRTFISKGFIEAARRQAEKVIQAVQQLDPAGEMGVVGVEPSEIVTLRDEYLDLCPGEEQAQHLSERAWLVDEYLLRPGTDGTPRILRIDNQLVPQNPAPGSNFKQKALLHGHCYQKAGLPLSDGYPSGVEATVSLLERVGYQVEVIQAGCCGMAGAFGYEREHYALSQQVAELALLPAVRQADPDTLIAAPGFSCQAQIAAESQRRVYHPLELVWSRLENFYSKIQTDVNSL